MSKDSSKLVEVLFTLVFAVAGVFYRYFVALRVVNIALTYFKLPLLTDWMQMLAIFLVLDVLVTSNHNRRADDKIDTEEVLGRTLRMVFQITLAWGMMYLFFGK